MIAGLGASHADQLVVLVQSQGDDAAAQRTAEGNQLGLLDGPAPRDHHQALVLAELAHRHHPGDPLPLAQLQQVDDRPSPGGPCRQRQVVDLQPVDLPLVGEEQDVVVRQSNEHVFEEIAFLGIGRGDAPAPSALGAVGAGRQPLDVAVVGDGHDHVFLADQRFLVEVADLLVGDHAAARVGVLGLQLAQVGADQVEDQVLVGQDPFVAGDIGFEPRVFLRQLVGLQPGQPLQLHGQNRIGLHSGQACRFLGLGVVRARAAGSRPRPPFPSSGCGPRAGWPSCGSRG